MIFAQSDSDFEPGAPFTSGDTGGGTPTPQPAAPLSPSPTVVPPPSLPIPITTFFAKLAQVAAVAAAVGVTAWIGLAVYKEAGTQVPQRRRR